VRIILLRHAESLGNIDELAYTRTPDHALPLTVRGEAQARAAGPAVRALLDGPVAAYVSPYVRAQRTFALLDVQAERVVPEPRLREQDWGNLQDPVEQELEKQRRHEFGHFFYRLPHGESGADVDDRVASFLGSDGMTAGGAGHHEHVSDRVGVRTRSGFRHEVRGGEAAHA
jgi:broad specificity phosphatase PhoE